MQIDPGPRRAIEHMLVRAQERLGMEAAFLAELTDTHQVYVATSGEATSFTIETGGSRPLIESYCRHIFESDEPWVIPDTRANDKVAHLEVTRAGNFGAYIGVPVHLPDGAAFGTLCGLSHTTRPDRTPTLVLDVETLRVDYVNRAGADMLGAPVEAVLG